MNEHEEATHQQSYRTTHCIGNYEHAFTLVIQRQAKRGQMSFDLEGKQCDELADKSTVYRAIATNQDNKTDSEVVKSVRIVLKNLKVTLVEALTVQ